MSPRAPLPRRTLDHDGSAPCAHAAPGPAAAAPRPGAAGRGRLPVGAAAAAGPASGAAGTGQLRRVLRVRGCRPGGAPHVLHCLCQAPALACRLPRCLLPQATWLGAGPLPLPAAMLPPVRLCLCLPAPRLPERQLHLL